MHWSDLPGTTWFKATYDDCPVKGVSPLRSIKVCFKHRQPLKAHEPTIIGWSPLVVSAWIPMYVPSLQWCWVASPCLRNHHTVCCLETDAVPSFEQMQRTVGWLIISAILLHVYTWQCIYIYTQLAESWHYSLGINNGNPWRESQ